MTGPVRAVLAAVLVGVLFLSAPATAAPLAAVRLDPARMFARTPETLLGFQVLDNAGGPIESALFGLRASTDGAALTATGSTVQSVHMTLPAPRVLDGGLGPLRIAHLPQLGFETAVAEPESFTANATLYADNRYDVPAPSLAQPDFGFAIAAAAPVRFGAYAPYVPALQTVSADVTLPLRVGPVRFSEQIESSNMQTLRPDAFGTFQTCGTTDAAAPCPYLSEMRAQNVVARTNLNVRAGNEILSLQFAGSVERLRNESAYVFAPMNPDLGQSDPQAGTLFYPGINAIVKHGLDAKLAVPVNAQLTVGLQYDRQHYQGDYGSLLFPGLDARKDTYLGNVTYQLPHSSSAITFSARHYRYQDTFAPNYNLQQTRADVDFTVKF